MIHIISLLIGILILIIIPTLMIILGFYAARLSAVLSIIIGFFLIGIPLGIISIIFTRKWYNSVKKKKKATKTGYIILMIFGILTIIVGIINLIFLIIFLT